MALDPFFDVLDVLLSIFEVFIEVALVAVEKVGLGGLGGLDGQRPGAVLDAGCDVSWESIGFGGFKVHILGAGFGVEVVEWVLGKLASRFRYS